MDHLTSHLTPSFGFDTSGYGEDSRALSPEVGLRASEMASRQEICEALTEMRPLRLARVEALDGVVCTCAGATAGESDEIQLLRSQIKRIAPYFRTALITGIQGTGKEGVARLLHALSPCAEGEFIAQEATVLAESMTQEKAGFVLDAMAAGPGGTLYLNEVGEVPLALQGALLRLWSSASRGKMRLVAGTHRDLRTMGVTGQFRQDLVQRLTGIELFIPSLRERRKDLPAALAEVLRSIGAERNLQLSKDAHSRLLAHAWAGDIAELNEVIQSAANAAGRRSMIEAGYLPELRAEEPVPADDMRMGKLQDVVRQHVLSVLTHCGGNKLRAAEILGISRSTLYRMLDTCASEGFAVS